MIIDHPRKGEEWREGDLQNGVRIMLIEGGEAYFFGGRHDDFENLDPDQHEPVDSPEESAALRAEVARLTKERDELIAAGVDLGDVALHLRGFDGSI